MMKVFSITLQWNIQKPLELNLMDPPNQQLIEPHEIGITLGHKSIDPELKSWLSLKLTRSRGGANIFGLQMGRTLTQLEPGLNGSEFYVFGGRNGPNRNRTSSLMTVTSPKPGFGIGFWWFWTGIRVLWWSGLQSAVLPLVMFLPLLAFSYSWLSLATVLIFLTLAHVLSCLASLLLLYLLATTPLSFKNK